MAKELPYFKFEPNQWENGKIQMCSKESKGLFIDMCSTYWSRLGELPYALALQKHCNGNTKALQELHNNQIIEIDNDYIVIEFLDEQLGEFQETSLKRQKAANKRWSNASALQKQSKSNAIREEKKREEKKKEEKIIYPFGSDFLGNWNIWKEYKQDQFNFKYKSHISEQAALKSLTKLTELEDEAIQIIHRSIENGWKGFFELEKKNNGNTKKSLRERTAEFIQENGL